MQLRRYRAVTDLDDNELARLILLAQNDVRELMGTLGFFAAGIHIRRGPAAPDGRPTIVVSVEPGAPTRVTAFDLRFQGDIAQTPDEDATAQKDSIRQAWRLPPGQGFTQDAWDDAKTQALRALVARRYPAGAVSYSLADIDPSSQAARLTLELDSGPLYRLGELRVSGLERYDPVLVPRLARLNPGDVYDQRKLVEAQQRLAGSGYFDSAFVTVDAASDPAAAPVSVQLREAKLQKVVLGLGLTTDSGPRASIEHTHNRLPGMGWRAVTQLQLERKSPLAQTRWTSLPDDNNWRWVGLARAERLDDDELVTRAQTLRFGRLQAGERIDRDFYVQYDRALVSASVPGIEDARAGEGSALSLNYGWTGRYFDNLPFPSRGYGLAFEAGGGTTLGNRRDPYTRLVGRWLGIAPLPAFGRGRLALRAEGGAVLAADKASLPATQLFRTGGDISVRGYGLRDIGITLPNGSTGPGRYVAVASAEWQQPIMRAGLPTDWEATVFADAGQVSNKASELGGDLAVGVGAGARWKSPIGPLDIDLAYGLQSRKARLHLSVGFVF
jgi:translocation and assembly module TamA